MKNKIEFRNIFKKYDDKEILKNISFKILDKEFITILGPSGCGKTTLLKMVNKLEIPTSGDIFIDNIDIKEYDSIKLRRNIGYAIQSVVLFPHLTVMENISYVPNLLTKKEKVALNLDIEKCLKIVNLDRNLLNRFPEELSGGQAQRVSIARALAANPDILLMDEPFSAVDEITREKLQNEMARIHKEANITVLFVTHDVKEALKLGTKVLILNKGVIEEFDTPANILKNTKSEFVKKLLSVNN